MKIRTITCERLHSFGSYENERLSAMAELTDDDDPTASMIELRRFVENEIKIREREAIAQQDVSQLTWQKQQLEAEIQNLKTLRDKAIKFLQEQGVTSAPVKDCDPFAEE